jgi:hypothetical protein
VARENYTARARFSILVIIRAIGVSKERVLASCAIAARMGDCRSLGNAIWIVGMSAWEIVISSVYDPWLKEKELQIRRISLPMDQQRDSVLIAEKTEHLELDCEDY